MRLRVSILFLLLHNILFAQVTTFNQYNGALPGINPAYIAGVDKNHAGIIFRNQWPGYRLGSNLLQVDANLFAPRFSSGLGIMYKRLEYNQGGYLGSDVSLQYAYRVIMFDDFFLCAAAGISLSQMNIDVSNFDYKMQPKYDFTDSVSYFISDKSVTGNYGIIFQQTNNGFYGGISIRDHRLQNSEVRNDGMELIKMPTVSVQGMYRFPVSRGKFLFAFVNYEKTGKIELKNDTSAKLIQPSLNYIAVQLNYFFDKKYIIGVGYKSFLKNYYLINYRASVMFGNRKQNTTGYSYDIKPYIKNDKIQSWSSHEIYYKRTF